MDPSALSKGKNCVSWQFIIPCHASLQVLLSISSLLTDPNPDDPLVPEIAHVSIMNVHGMTCARGGEREGALML